MDSVNPLMGRMFLVLAVAAPASGAADTFVVSPDGTGDFPTIQAAIDGAQNGDVIELAAGTFTGDGNRDVDYSGKAVAIRSQSGNAEECVIDCEGADGDPHQGFLFVSGEGPGSILESVTVTGGHASGPTPSDLGGAVACLDSSSPTIRDCRFLNNAATFGGAVACKNSASPVISGCVFTGNSADRGGAVFCQFSSSPDILQCSFSANSADRGGALYCQFTSSPAVSDCAFSESTATGDGGAVHCSSDCSPSISGCTFWKNSCAAAGGGIYLSASSLSVERSSFSSNSAAAGAGGIACNVSSSVTGGRCIIASSLSGAAVVCSGGSEAALVCCDLFGNEGGDWVGSIAGQDGTAGNISLDPVFCDEVNGDLTIAGESPCAPFSAPNEECALIGAGAIACGNPPATVSMTWGRIKSRVR